MGERELAVYNSARILYLIFNNPLWGFSVAVNTMVSNAMGSRQYQKVRTIMRRTSILTFLMTMIIAIPVLMYPKIFIGWLFNAEQMIVLDQSQEIVRAHV